MIIEDLINLLSRFLVNIVMCFVTVRYIYSVTSKNREFMFALYAFNIVIFALCCLLNDVKLELGSGFGLFALFGLLNYRTEVMKTKDMTYLLVVIAYGFINGLYSDWADASKAQSHFVEILVLNLLIVGTIYILERQLLHNFQTSARLRYEKIELIKPERRSELLADLCERTGLEISDFSIEDINYLNDTVLITIYYRERVNA
ncbi:MAG: DUF4956 domain-containing protein [Bacteroidia bacterium]